MVVGLMFAVRMTNQLTRLPSLHYLLLHQAALIRPHQLVSANWNQSRQGVTTRAGHILLRCLLFCNYGEGPYQGLLLVESATAFIFKNLLRHCACVLNVEISISLSASNC